MNTVEACRVASAVQVREEGEGRHGIQGRVMVQEHGGLSHVPDGGNVVVTQA